MDLDPRIDDLFKRVKELEEAVKQNQSDISGLKVYMTNLKESYERFLKAVESLLKEE